MATFRKQNNVGQTQLYALAKLRWTAIAGQLVLIGLGNFALNLELPWSPLLCILLVSALSNFALISTPTTAMSRCILLFDILLLTATLFFYGGYTNPFSTAYLVYVTIAAFFLGKRWTWIAMALSSVCFASLFYSFIPVAAFSMHQHGSGTTATIHGLQLHLQGMLVAFILIGALIAFFITKMSSELEDYRRRIFSEDKLAALASLTAGAAHELATPLGSAYLIAEELNNKRSSSESLASSGADIAELYGQLDRAKVVLSRMRSRSPDFHGETLSAVDVSLVLRECIHSFTETEQARIKLEEVTDAFVRSTPLSLQEAQQVLLKNALEASSPESVVTVNVRQNGGEIQLSVRNACQKISDENFGRMGEPFFTTKPVGEGMGLGLYLVKAFAAQMRGRLELIREETALIAKLVLPAY